MSHGRMQTGAESGHVGGRAGLNPSQTEPPDELVHSLGSANCPAVPAFGDSLATAILGRRFGPKLGSLEADGHECVEGTGPILPERLTGPEPGLGVESAGGDELISGARLQAHL